MPINFQISTNHATEFPAFSIKYFQRRSPFDENDKLRKRWCEFECEWPLRWKMFGQGIKARGGEGAVVVIRLSLFHPFHPGSSILWSTCGKQTMDTGILGLDGRGISFSDRKTLKKSCLCFSFIFVTCWTMIADTLTIKLYFLFRKMFTGQERVCSRRGGGSPLGVWETETWWSDKCWLPPPRSGEMVIMDQFLS